MLTELRLPLLNLPEARTLKVASRRASRTPIQNTAQTLAMIQTRARRVKVFPKLPRLKALLTLSGHRFDS